MSEIQNKAEKIRLVIFDIDGVLTNGGLQFDNDGREYKTFNSLDGQGIRMLLEFFLLYQIPVKPVKLHCYYPC